MSRGPASAMLAAILVATMPAALGCGSSKSFVHSNFDFSSAKRAAVIPFQNLSIDFLAGERMQSIFLMELLRQDVLALVDPRETAAAMKELGFTSGSALTSEQSIALGKKLGVDALFFGVVEEYNVGTGDRSRGPVITGVYGMTETQTGVLVWRAQIHSTGGSLWRKLFGGAPADLYSVSRKNVQEALRTLL